MLLIPGKLGLATRPVVVVKQMKINYCPQKRQDLIHMWTISKLVEFAKQKHIKLALTTAKNVRTKRVYALCVEQKF